MNSDVIELEEYLYHMNNELGDYCRLLVDLNNYGYCLNDDFKTALSKEIQIQLKYIKEHATIITENEVTTNVITRVVWKH